MMYRLFSILLILCSSFSLFGQEMEYDNKVYVNDIETVLLLKNIDIYDPFPMIRLGSNETLKLNFDQLKSQNEFFNYTLIHCDADWQASDMQQTEYLLGNAMGDITEFSYSTNTYQQYVHYELEFPTERMQIIRSGNYILKVFNNFDETDLVLTRRFMVLDEQVKTSATIRGATEVRNRNSHQEVDVEIDYTGFTVPNPYQDVRLTIMQNNSWESAVYNLTPLFVGNNILNFNYEQGNVFAGGNEFRSFDIRTLRFFSNQVAKKFMDSLTNVVLIPDETRSHKSYVNWIDYNGKRVVANRDGSNVIADGDYALVHFWLNTKDKSALGEIYVYGELSDWQLKPEFKMEYDSASSMYYGKALLKQSYYNYVYVLKDNRGELDYSFTEGTHRDTENDYSVLVYHRNVSYNYDELIGYVSKNSSAK